MGLFEPHGRHRRGDGQTDLRRHEAVRIYNQRPSWPGLSRPSQGECIAFVRTPRRCKKLSKLAASAWRGCPGQARARRAGGVCDLRFTPDLAEPDSRGMESIMREKNPI